MLRHYYTLYKIAQEVSAHCKGALLTECFTQDKGTLVVCFERGAERWYVEYSLDVRSGGMSMRKDFHRARSNTVDLFPQLLGRTVEAVTMADHERVMTIRCSPQSAPVALDFWFFGGKRAAGFAGAGNVLCVDASGNVAGAFKSADTLVGKSAPLPASTVRYSLQQAYKESLKEQSTPRTLLATLAQCDILLGKEYAWEVLWRWHDTLRSAEPRASHGQSTAALLQSRLLHTCSWAEIEAIEHLAQTVRHECLTSTQCYIYRVYPCSNAQHHDAQNGHGELHGSTVPMMAQITLSLIPLHHYQSTAVLERTVDSVSHAVRLVQGLQHKEQTFRERYVSIRDYFERQQKKLCKALHHLAQDTENAHRARERQEYAELLLSQPNIQQRGLSHIVLHNWSGSEVRIALNPAKSLRENAEEYFAKARTAKESLRIRAERTQGYAKQLQDVQALLSALETVTDMRSLEAVIAASPLGRSASLWKQRMTNEAWHRAVQSAHSPTQGGKFRQFDLEGYVLYVGKTAADNDELTMRFAKPQDYWFHARGVAGSHAVLRGGTKDKKPPKHVIEWAASIAAYYSKARNATLTPVVYTQKKYVRKPKGSAVGAVAVERETVVMVRPQLPSGSQELVE